MAIINISTVPELSVDTPKPVRNPLEFKMETNNYVIFIAGQKTIVTVGFDDIYDMEVGDQFTATLESTVVTFTIVASPSNENEVLPRSAFPGGIMGSNNYGVHLQSKFIGHSVIGAKFTSTYVYAGMDDTHTDIELKSILNEPLSLVFAKVSGDYSLSSTINQNGIFDKYEDRPTVS